MPSKNLLLMALGRSSRLQAAAAASALIVGILGGLGGGQAAGPGCEPARPAVVHRPSGAPATAPTLIPCVYPTGHRSMEPSLGFTSDGRALFQAWELSSLPGGLPPKPVLLRREANGVWKDVSPGPVTHPTSLDPYLYVDRSTGRIFALDWIAHGLAPCSTLSFSDDDGETWITSPLACGGFDGESIAAGPPVSSTPIGYDNVVYYCTSASLGSGGPVTTPACSKSLDGGLTFVPTLGFPYKTTEAEGVFPGWTGNPVVGADGTLYLPKRHEGQPSVAISRDEGATWTRVRVATNGSAGAATRMTVDASGNLSYTWIGDDHLPYIASSTHGETWTAPVMIAAPGVNEAALARIVAGPDGAVAVAYLGTTSSPGAPYYDFCNVHLDDCADGRYEGVRWNGYLALIAQPSSSDPVIRTATVRAAPSPLFIGGCSADGACKAVLDFIDVQFDDAGDPWAAFVDDCAVDRDFMPLFSPDLEQCGDGVGEGIVLRLTAA